MTTASPIPPAEAIETLIPIPGKQPGEWWIAVTKSGQLVTFDTESDSVDTQIEVPKELPLTPEEDYETCRKEHSLYCLQGSLTLTVSKDGRFAALGARRGQYAGLFDLATGKLLKLIDRGTYCIEVSDFSLCFIEHRGKTLLVHASDWNRLEVLDPATGDCITERSQIKYGQPLPEHYLDYFHCNLTASPNSQWITDDGWVWHPWGVVRSWQIAKWIDDNPYESEDGESIVESELRPSFWDGPLCWIDEQHLAVWGYEGTKDDDTFGEGPVQDFVQVYDISNQKVINRFECPNGLLYSDGKQLICCSPDSGTYIFEPFSGTLEQHLPELKPLSWHPQTKRFIYRDKDNLKLLTTVPLENN